MPLPALYRIRILSSMITLLTIIGFVAAAGVAAPAERDGWGGVRQAVFPHGLPLRG